MDSNISDALYKNLSFAREEFEPHNKAFMLNVDRKNEITLQILHRSYNEHTRHENNSFGFAIHITFPSNTSGIQYHDRFKKLNVSKDFLLYYYEDIPCYIIDLDKDIRRTTDLATVILKDVYELTDRRKLRIKLSDESEANDW